MTNQTESKNLYDFELFLKITKNHKLILNLIDENKQPDSPYLKKRRLSFLIKFMRPGVNALISKQDLIPEELIDNARKYVKIFNDNLNKKGSPSIKDAMLNDVEKLQFVDDLYKQIKLQLSRRTSEIADFTFFDIFIILSFFNENVNNKEEVKRLIEDEIDEKALAVDKRMNSIIETEQTINTLLDNIQEKSKEIINRNYAGKFQEQAERHSWISFGWLLFGILTIIIFIFLIFKTDIYYELETQSIQEIISPSGVVEYVSVYNITNIILKVAIIALQIFLISFAFKQFSVNRHLSTINKHRANAFNSYEFFAAATKDDTESHKTLMLQLAKAIYEQTTTGYLGSKENVNPSWLEITNLIKSTGGN